MDKLQQLDMECFPTLKNVLERDGITLEELLQTSPRKCFNYVEKKHGWREELHYAGLNISVLVHGKSPYFVWKEVKEWIFHHAKKLSVEDVIEPYFEVWIEEK